MTKHKLKQKQQQNGFISIFFILTISFTFLAWIALSSERVFEYIHIRDEFIKNRSFLQNKTLCANAFINNLVKSKYSLEFNNNEYNFNRNLYFNDNYYCHIKNINMTYLSMGMSIDKIFFILDGFSFEYQFKNGFVNSIKSFNLF